MNPWWWVPIGLAVWFLVGLAVALLIGPVLRHTSRARDTMDRRLGEMPDEDREPPQDNRRAS